MASITPEEVTVKKLSELLFDLRVRWEFFDDLVDFLWSGRCYHCDIVACSADEQLLADYCDWLREQGPWTLSFVADERVSSGQFWSLNYRGAGLFRWGSWVETVQFERTGYSFEPVVDLEA